MKKGKFYVLSYGLLAAETTKKKASLPTTKIGDRSGRHQENPQQQ